MLAVKTKKKSIIKPKQSLFAFLIGLYVFTIFLYGARSETLFITDSAFSIIVVLQMIYLINSKFIINRIALISIPFLGLLMIGTVYSSNFASSFSLVKTCLLLYMFMLILLENLDNEEIITLVLKYIMFASFIMCVYIIYFYGFDRIVNAITLGKRIGYEISQPNTIGHYAAIGFVISIYNLLYDSMIRVKLFSVLISLTTFTIVLASLSRKALFLAIIGSFILYIGRESFKVTRVITFLIVLIMIYNLLSIIPQFIPFFDRLNSALSLMLNSGIESNQSDILRKQLIELGINMFKNRPLFGYGTGEFRYLAAALFGSEVASHNNYIELAVNNGLFGLFAYYVPYIYMVTYYIKRIIPSKKGLGILLFSLLITDLIISGMTMFTYISKISVLFFSLSLAYMVFNKKKLL
ncbi:MAG: O-antigen ligase family protein [Erysipelotrichaceae bacterium]|nr:O-antigen ligase family protein [Erysipelotrichaceae bacterium]